jgi:hypothetical protein
MTIVVGLLFALLISLNWLAFRQVRSELERVDGRLASVLGAVLDRKP